MGPKEDQGRIRGLDASTPRKDDPLEEGPAHLRELKRVVQGAFGGFGGAVLVQGLVVRDEAVSEEVYPVLVADWDVGLFTAGSLLLFCADKANEPNPKVWLNRARLMRWVDGSGTALPPRHVAPGEWTLSVADGAMLRLLSAADVPRVMADFKRELARVQTKAREREQALTQLVEGYGEAVTQAQDAVRENQASIEYNQKAIEALDVEGIKGAVLEDLKGRFETRLEETDKQVASTEAAAQSAEEAARSAETKAQLAEETARSAEDKAQSVEETARSAEDKAQLVQDKARSAETKAADLEDKVLENTTSVQKNQSEIDANRKAIAANAKALGQGSSGAEGAGLRRAVQAAEDKARSAEDKARSAEDKAQSAQDKARSAETKAADLEDKVLENTKGVQNNQSEIEANRKAITANTKALEQGSSGAGGAGLRRAVQAAEDKARSAEDRARSAEETARSAETKAQSAEDKARSAETKAADLQDKVLENTTGVQNNQSKIDANEKALEKQARQLKRLSRDRRGELPWRWNRYQLLTASVVNRNGFRWQAPRTVKYVGVACWGAGGKQKYTTGDAGAGGAGFAFGVFALMAGDSLASMQVGTNANDGRTFYGDLLVAHPGGDATYEDFASVPGEGGEGEVKPGVLCPLKARGGRGGGVRRVLPKDSEGSKSHQYGEEAFLTVGGGGGGAGSFYGDGGAGGEGVSGAYLGSAGGGGGFGGTGGVGQAASACGGGGGGVCESILGGGLARGGAAGQRSLASEETGADWQEAWGLGGGGGGGSCSAGQAGRPSGWLAPFSSGGHGGSGLNGVGGEGALTLSRAAGRGVSYGTSFLDLAHRCLGGGGGGGANVYHACGGDGGPGGGGGGACVTKETRAYARAGMGGVGGGGGGAGVCPVYVWSDAGAHESQRTLSVPSQGCCGGDSLFGGGGGGGGYGGQGGRCLLGGGGLGGKRSLGSDVGNERSPGCIILYWFERKD
ncbi:MAG: hypothetical protein ABW161_01225 [Candidatus Thiodiazotropha sp.]